MIATRKNPVLNQPVLGTKKKGGPIPKRVSNAPQKAMDPKKKKVFSLLSGNIRLTSGQAKVPGYTPEKLMVRLYKRAIYPISVSLTRSSVTSKASRVRLRRRMLARIQRFKKEKLARRLNVDPYSSFGRQAIDVHRTNTASLRGSVLGPDNIFKIVPLSSMFKSNLGPGQHSRRYMSPTVAREFGSINNSRFFFDFNEFTPGLHPYRRLLGCFIKKGKKQRSYSLFSDTLSNFKVALRKKISHPDFLGRGLYRNARSDAMPAVLYGVQSALYNARPVFRATLRKVAAAKKKTPTLNNLNKSYSTFFSSLNLCKGATKKAKGATPLDRPFTLSSFYPRALGTPLAESFLRKGSLYKQAIENIKEARSLLVNMRFNAGARGRKSRRR